jgi:hypothetical protein
MVSVPGIDVTYYFHSLINFLTDSAAFWAGVKAFVGLLVGISIPLSVALLIGIVIVVEGLKIIRTKEEEKYTKKAEPAYFEERVNPELAKRWSRIMDHINSDNENDWRQAIIEADSILETLLVELGYQGEGIGERLRRVNKGDFKTLNQAGEAHGFRNRIAHDGSQFSLNKIEAQRIIGLYRQVFEEFYHISG